MAKFFMFENKDAGLAYEQALVGAGHVKFPRWVSMMRGDFGLVDHEHAGNRIKLLQQFMQSRPVFVYPHTPLAYFLWDANAVSLPVSCNFVAGEAARAAMRAYGYPHRVETVGFSRCEVREFTPTSGAKLLFVPARQRGGSGGYATKEYTHSTPSAFQFVLDHRKEFESITVCYTRDFVGESDYWGSGIKFVKTDPGASPSPTADMLRNIDNADLVISCETVGCLAVARGVPTVFYNARSTPALSGRYVRNYEKYRKYYQFPLTLEEMTIGGVLGVCKRPNAQVEEWKRGNIGGNFDPGKFLRIVGEFV